jgi:XRE family aerobic/anaerobic benzoate catabolism transcriptional regulator
MDGLLASVGQRVRAARTAREWRIADLSRRSGLSLRFVADVEHGKGNISLLRLAELAQALEVSLASLVGGLGPARDRVDELCGLDRGAQERALIAARSTRKIALVGLRGAGKSTVGQELARRIGTPLVEVDAAVEQAAGMPLGQLFEFHGEERYRALEREVLGSLLGDGQRMVLATGGSIVTAPETWGMVRRGARTVWLHAPPSVHLARVEAQGDYRPMRGRTDALADMREILRVRNALYAEAELHLDTAGASPGELAGAIAGWMGA